MDDLCEVRLEARACLSARERGVLECLARGMTDKEAGARLGIALPSVRVYRRRAEGKLGVKGAALCLLVAWRLGEIDLDGLGDEALAQRTGCHGPPPDTTPREPEALT